MWITSEQVGECARDIDHNVALLHTVLLRATGGRLMAGDDEDANLLLIIRIDLREGDARDEEHRGGLRLASYLRADRLEGRAREGDKYHHCGE